MKKVLSLILAISMVMSMFTFSFAGVELKDIAGTEYQSAVEALVELGIVNGYEDGTYQPEKVVTRAEMAKLLVSAAKLEKNLNLDDKDTDFSDSDGHWAAPYINVAAQYGYIVGDPEGTFRPDDTVNYHEAATMALRVLGYKTVAESKGVWPSNYMDWAERLDIFEDVKVTRYQEGATRGNIAILVWNMLKATPWDIIGETEGNGLEYSNRGAKSMLEIKFPDYKYVTTTFVSFEIGEEAKVLVGLSGDKYNNLEYLKNDFYKFVEGTEVEALINTKDEVLLSMVPTSENKLIEGTKDEIDDKYDELNEKVFVYGYARVKNKSIVDSNWIDVENTYVYEVSTSNKNYVKLNKNTKLYYEDEEDTLFLKDGERATIKDIEVGDILSAIYINENVKDKGATPVFYMIGSSEIEGTLTKLVETEYEELPEEDYLVATIDGEEYVLAGDAKYYEDPEDMEDDASFTMPWNKSMKGEEVTAVLDVFGRVTAVLFDGKIDAGDEEEDTTVKFYGVTEPVVQDGRDYILPVRDIDGDDELMFADRAEGKLHWLTDGIEVTLEGAFMAVEINKDGKISALTESDSFYVHYEMSGDLEDISGDTIQYGEEENEFYSVVASGEATYDKDTKTILGKKVGSSTVVVTLALDDNGTKKTTTDDFYTVTFEEGISSIERLKNKPAVVITDNATKLGRALYVVIFDEVSTKGEDELVGIIADKSENLIGETLLTVDDVKLSASEIKKAKKDAMILADDSTIKANALEAGQVIIYSTEVNEDDETIITVLAHMIESEFNVNETGHGYVPSEDQNGEISEDGREALVIVEGNELVVDLDSELDFNGETLDFSDFRFILVEVELDDEDKTNDTQFVPVSVGDVDFESIEFKFLDRISMNESEEIIIIIRGMEKR